MRVTQLFNLSLFKRYKLPIASMGALLLSIVVAHSSIAEVLSNPRLSKRAISLDAQLSAKARLSAEQPAAEVLILVEKKEPQNSIETASIGKTTVIAETSPITGQRRSTPSKVKVQMSEPTASTPTSVVTPVFEEAEPQIAIQPSTEVLILVEPTNKMVQGKPAPLEKNNATHSNAAVLTTSSVQSTPATRRHIEAKVPASNTAQASGLQKTGVEAEPINALYQEGAAPIDMSALTAFLSTPSKTPVATMGMLSALPDQQAVDIAAKSALIIDRNSREVLFSRNALESMPIASITKLMTAMVVLDAKQNLNQKITITKADIDTLKNTSSRLAVGSKLSRKDLLHLTLMSSENRAAHALSRNYPGGTRAFVNAMNQKARALGMAQTNYVDPTGLSDQNRSSARDLIWLVDTASNYKLIKQLSTSKGHKISLGKRRLSYINSNRLIDDKGWDIALQKTGYIREAGYCMVLQTKVSNKDLIMVLLDTDAKASRLLDAESMREWVQS